MSRGRRDFHTLAARLERSTPMVQTKSQITLAAVEYPCSDGIPMAETERHAMVTMDARQALGWHFRDRPDVYVGVDMLLYYVEGDPKRSVAPDVFVVLDAPKLPPRDNWLVWAEGGRTPDFVLEITSKATQAVDEGRKRRLYRELGVSEYWQYDPTGDYLDPALKGSRLIDGRYRPIKSVTELDGSLRFRSDLGLELRLERDELRFFDVARRKYLPTCEEAFEHSGQLEEARREIAGLKAELAAKRREGEARGRLPSEENAR